MPPASPAVPPQRIEQALTRVHDQPSFLQELLAGALGWNIPGRIERLEDISFGWSADELRAGGLDRHLVDGQVLQIQPLRPEQPWAVFVLEFKNPDVFTTGRGMTGPLRRVLRGLVPSRRRDSKLAAWEREHLLFICTHAYQHFRFAYFKAPPGETKTAPLATFGWFHDDTSRRTACEFNLPELAWPDPGIDPGHWVAQWAKAFDVEKVTKAFYTQYAQAFARVEAIIKCQGNLKKPEDLRLFTQMLFNRLMFLRFIERKGWLDFRGDRDYLRALRQAGPIGKRSLYQSRIVPLFFDGLATEGHQQSDAIGKVPFLNGGLFEETDLDRQVKDIPDEAFAPIIAGGGLGLFYRFNFTVEESTPLDIEVAVDPEMLGKVFEELVTGRHESGSYFTPRPVVSFMCREAIKGYLMGKTKAPAPAIAALVDQHQVQGLTESHARQIIDALDDLKAVDPACGSGAYLLGLLQELVAIYRLLYSEKLVKDARSLYDLKLRIISHGLYGVDIDPFATNIAMLRLWLSLAVEMDQPLPLPNLDFKIETGDSLTGPCDAFAPDIVTAALHNLAEKNVRLKEEYLVAHGAEKRHLHAAVESHEEAIAKALAHPEAQGIIDWRVHFAEVFSKNGGFGIVLANPPYVRQELIKHLKPALKAVYDKDYCGTADLYIFFYLRALQLLAPSGMLAFISSNKWFRAGYGEKLRAHIARTTTVHTILDFHDLPVFDSAIAYPMVFIAGKQPPPKNHAPTLAEPTSLERPYPDVTAVVVKYGRSLPAAALAGDGTWQLASASAADRLKTMRSAGPDLATYIRDRMYFGIKTSFNKAFVLTKAERDALVAKDRRSSEILKPVVLGKDVNRWSIDREDRWLVLTKIGTDIGKYPAVLKHLGQWQTDLQAREDQGEHWWELRSCAYYDAFAARKIMWGNMGLVPRFAIADKDVFAIAPANIIASDDLYLLAVLNSSSAASFFSDINIQRGGSYLEFKPMYVKQLPIPAAPAAEKAAIGALAQKCLDAQGQGCAAWEREIDQRVAALYGL